MKSKRARRFVAGADYDTARQVWGERDHCCCSMTFAQARKSGASKYPEFVVYELVPVAPENKGAKR